MKGKKLGELGLEGLLLMENSGLVSQNCMHVSAKGLHVLGKEESVFLCLVPKSVKTVSESEHRVLEIRCRTRWSCPCGLW